MIWLVSIMVLPFLKAEESPVRCQHPDNATDFAEQHHDGSQKVYRPPANFSEFIVTNVDVHSLNLSWSIPTLSMDAAVICHYSLVASYKSPQAGATPKNIQMSTNFTKASFQDLPMGTNITAQLRACLQHPELDEFVCTKATRLSVFTLTPEESCPTGQYKKDDQCVDCQCNGESKICRHDTGVCLDCKNMSNEPDCEKLESTSPMTAVPTTRMKFRTSSDSSARRVMNTSTTTKMSTMRRFLRPRMASSTRSLTLIIVICALLGLLILALLVIITYKKYRKCRKVPAPFWTIQLQNEGDSVTFSETLDAQYCQSREDNRLIDNDYTDTQRHPFASDENPYRTLTSNT